MVLVGADMIQTDVLGNGICPCGPRYSFRIKDEEAEPQKRLE